ncbi:MAG: hypothetical protein OSA82_13485 [Paracoccaceae bacterium]|nr:hypothetical protein [Paracoccaceae bacterium]
MTLTPCKGRTGPRDALPVPNALVFYAKIQRCAAGRSVGCMAQVVVHLPVLSIRTIGTGLGQIWRRTFAAWQANFKTVRKT